MYRVPEWTCTKVSQNGCTTSVHIILCTEMVCTEMDMYRSGPNLHCTSVAKQCNSVPLEVVFSTVGKLPAGLQ